MSNNQDWYDDDELEFDDYAEEETKPRKGDDALAKVRRSERAKEKELKAVKAELEQLRKFQREATVSKVLSEKGVNPKIAAFIPQDIESTEDSIGSWLEQYGDVFGVTTQAPSQSNDTDIAALRQIDAVTSGAISPDNINDAFSTISNAASAEELLDFLYSQGAE